MFDTQEMRAPGLPAESAPAVPLPPSAQPVHLLDRLNAVFKHRRLAATVFSLVLGALMVQSYSTVPVYETHSQIEIQDERTTSIGNIGISDPQFFQDTEPYYKTQYQILQSRELGRRVVRRLNLAQVPEFNGTAPRPRDPLTLLRNARSDLSAWFRGVISKQPAEPPKPAALDAAAQEEALIGLVMGGVEIVPVRESRLVNIVYRHTNPQFAALAANTIAEEYTAQNLEKRLETTNNQLAFLDRELASAQDNVQNSEAAVTQYREQNNAQSLDERSNIVNVKLSDLNTQLLAAGADVQTTGIKYRQVKDVDVKSPTADTYEQIAMDADVVTARGKVAGLEVQAKTLSQRYGENHPEMVKTQLQLDAARGELIAARMRVVDRIKNEYERAVIRQSAIAQQLEAAKGDVGQLARKAIDYNILKTAADANRQMLGKLTENKQQLLIVANSRQNNVKLMDRAQVPGAPIKPNTRKDLITAILAGLTLAFGIAFGIEYLDDSVKTPEDVTRRLRLPLLGLVPAVRGERVPVLTESVPHDFGEAFRSLRTSLVFTSGGESTRVIAVTSSQPLEGKTTTACNLALALALGGSRVLLIDADMRRPGLHKTIRLHNGLGLSHLLTGQSRVREVVQRTREPNLFVITAGRTPPNPSELLQSERMDHLLANLARGPFDWVVIDTPPVLAVTDAVILAQKIGSVVFVIGSEMTRRVHAERALETLQAAKIRNIGAVLNRVDFDRNKYYYARYYGYQYKSYYGQNTVA